MADKKVLLVTPSERLRDPLAGLLGSVGYEVHALGSAAEADAWRRIHRCDLAIVDLDGDDIQRASELVAAMRMIGSTKTDVLVLVRSTSEARIKDLFKSNRLTNFLAVPADEQIDPVELTVTVSKILSKDIFGFGRYLAPAPRTEQIVIRGSRQRRTAVDAVETFALRVGCHRRVSEALAVAADELITNAIYNAPIDRDGKPRFAHYARDRDVELVQGEEVKVQMAFDGRRMALATIDCFGSLEKARVLDYLTKCFAKGSDQVDSKAGGAGLGLYYVFNAMHHLVINIAGGQCTEVIGLIEVTRSYKEHSSKAKSFNVFVKETP